MEEKYLLKGSITRADNDKRLIDLAAKRGIKLPHPALGAFHSILSEIETPNGNGVALSNQGAIEALDTIIGTQINPNHDRAVAYGHTFWAEINDKNQIEIAFVFFKDIFPDEYDEAVDLQKQGKLAISWEISSDRTTNETFPNGTRRLNNFTFLGTGLLYGLDPACPIAYPDEVAYLNHKDPELIFAKKVSNKVVVDTARSGNTSTETNHNHGIDIDDKGNGKTVNIFTTTGYEGDANHVHEIKDGVVLPGGLDNHTHLITWVEKPAEDIKLAETKKKKIKIHKVMKPYTYWACPHCEKEIGEKELHMDGNLNLYHTPCKDMGPIDWPEDETASENLKKYLLKATNKGENTMEFTQEQKDLIAKLKTDLGEYAKDFKDEDFLDETKVAEARKSQTEATAKAEAEAKEKADNDVKAEADRVAKEEADKQAKEKADAEAKVEAEKKAIEDIKAENEALKSKVAELEASVKAKDAEVAKAKADYEKIGKAKTELKDNVHAKDFKDEDYLDETKVTQAKTQKENDDLKAKLEKANKEEDLETGHEEADSTKDMKPADVVTARVKELRGKKSK